MMISYALEAHTYTHSLNNSKANWLFGTVQWIAVQPNITQHKSMP